MEAITRKEKIMSGENLTPITRKEKFLAKAAGMDVETPEPITREEMFLSKIQGGSGGDGGSGGTGVIEPLDVTENGVYTPPEGVNGYSPVNVLVSSPAERIELDNAIYFFYNGARLDLLDKVDTSESVSFSYMFYGCRNLQQVPNLDTSKGNDFGSMFSECQKLTTVPNLDVSNGTNFSYMFNNCHLLTNVPNLDTNKGMNFGGMFYNCIRLTQVPYLNIDKANGVSNVFYNCKELRDLYLYNIRKSLHIGEGTTWGHLLTVDSLVHTIKELCAAWSNQTLTMGSANIAKISGLYCKIIDDTNEKKPMELCESTDDGAMTLIDYATEKGWTIA